MRADAVERQRAVDEHVAIEAVAAPDQRAHARLELGELERLDQIVVGTGVEPGDAIRDRIGGGDDQDRRRRRAAAKSREDLPSRDARQAEVEDDELERLRAQCGIGGRAITGPVDGVPAMAQVLDNRIAEQRIVFGHQNSQRVSPREAGPAMLGANAASAQGIRGDAQPASGKASVCRTSPVELRWTNATSMGCVPASAGRLMEKLACT